MKNVNIEQLRIPAYAVMDVKEGVVFSLNHTREDARATLRDVKFQTDDHRGFKILKLKAEKFIR